MNPRDMYHSGYSKKHGCHVEILRARKVSANKWVYFCSNKERGIHDELHEEYEIRDFRF